MASKTTICNIAADALRQNALDDFATDNTPFAVACRRVYDQVRDEVTRSHPWNCAMARAILGDNLLTYSEQFDNAAWTKTNATVTANQTRAPDGTETADELDDSDGTNAGTVDQSATVPNNDDKHTFAVYLKEGTASESAIKLAYSGGTGTSTTVTVTWGSSPSVDAGVLTEVDDGWWRVSVTVDNNESGNTTLTATIYPAGTTGSATGTVYAWGAQVTQSDAAVGYVDTTSASKRSFTPKYGWEYGFDLPADWLRTYDKDRGNLEYKIEGKKVLARTKPIELRYVRQMDETGDEDIMDPLFREVLGLEIAMRLRGQFNPDRAVYQEIDEMRRRAWMLARTTDAQEDGADPFVEDPWNELRHSYGESRWS